MSKINGAGTSFSLGDEEPGSPENDDPDETADGLNATFHASHTGNSAQSGNLEWGSHAYGQHGGQVQNNHRQPTSGSQMSELFDRARVWGAWLIMKGRRGNDANIGYNQIPVAEAGSRRRVSGPYTPASTTPEVRPSFLRTVRQILSYSWSNLFLVFVPIGYITYLAEVNAPIVFTSNALAIIPLSNLLTLATECIARDMGDSVGALLNISFGNLIEMIIFSALANDHIRIVQAALLGSILVNLLLILGTAVLVGSIKYQELEHNTSSAQTLACLLALSVFSMLIPSAFHYSFRDPDLADQAVLKLSRASSVLLLIIYILYLLFHLKSHAYLTRTIPAKLSKPESDVETPVQRNYSVDSPRTSTSSSNPTPMKFVNRNGRVFNPSSASNDTIELRSIESCNASVSKSNTVNEPELVQQTSDDGCRVSPINHITETRPSTNERPFSRSRASALPFLSYNISPNQPADYLTTQSSSTSTNISRPASLTLLLTCSALVSISAFFLTNTIDAMVANTPLSEAFIGLIILPIAGNAAEHITAMTVAAKNKMDLAIGVSVGSSIQIALCVTPAVVLLGWGMGKDMSLYFSLFETVTLVAAAGVVVVVILNGRTNYLEGWLLCACYIIVGFGAYLYPTPTEQMRF